MVRGSFGVVAVVIGLAGLVASACSSSKEDGKAADQRQWFCSDADDSCACTAFASSGTVYGPGAVDGCFDSSCCLLTQSGADDADARCECLYDVADCAAEVESRRGVEQVSQCPPPGEGSQPDSMCAATGENCSQRYLDQNDLSGCCEDHICKPNSAGVSVCQEATERELADAQECSRATRSEELHTLELATPTLVTSVGEVELPPVKFAFFGVGPAGCVNSLRLVLGSDSGYDCQLELEAGLEGSELTFSLIRGDISGCAGYAGDGTSGGYMPSTPAPPGDVQVETVACDAKLVFESYCIGGSFDFHLDGVVGPVTFEDQHVILQGGICSADPEGDCPLR